MITRRCITPIPITPAIIKMVHRIAKQDGMPKGLKITNCTRQVLFNSTWIAGVDYDEDEFEDKDYDHDSDETKTVMTAMMMTTTKICMTKWIQMQL
jgi:hypothetical protein